MRTQNAGCVTRGLWYLGRPESGVYVLESDGEAAIISGGMAAIIPDVVKQMSAFGIAEGKIRKAIILHAHFDHVGIIPYFVRRNPQITVYASERGWNILKTPRAVDTINAFNCDILQRWGMTSDLDTDDWEWHDDITGASVKEGSCITVGDHTLSVIETPGHSSCSVSLYEPEMKALFPSDAGGIPYRDSIIPSGNSNFTLFQESLKKLQRCDVDYFCADHYGYVTGTEARDFVDKSITAAASFRKVMERVYRREGSVERAVTRLVNSVLALYPDYFLPRDILEGIYGQMIKHIARVCDERQDMAR